jgi:arabinofuranan 3-O-arabinosyltransferase
VSVGVLVGTKRSRDPAWWASPGVGLLLLVFSVLQRPGETTFDTKFDLTANPGPFLERAVHLWNPQSSFGELQNQAYGYLFPQGPFFMLGEVAHLPDWVVQRLWSAALLILAYDGARRLYRAIAPTSGAWLPVVAGAAFALSPRLLGLSGVLTAEILPTAVLPWVVLPLVHALHGRYRPLTGALCSGAAMLFMGGVNATENLATLPLPILVLVFGLGTSRGRRLAAWWAGTAALACAWWLLPLLVLGRYSPPFLDYIETAAATTRPLGWANVLRGADHWLAFIFVGGEPWWPGAYELATSPWLVGVTGVVATVSLAGLFQREMPARGPLTASAVLGLVLLTVGHVSPVGSPLADVVRDLLNGPFAPLRNVHKVDPLVRLPFALGFAHAVGLVLRRPRRAAETRSRFGTWIAIALGVLLVASAQPLTTGELRKPGWEEVPRPWYQVVEYLAEHSDGRRALVLPGAGFGQQFWGWTIDEPIQGLARSPWVVRGQIPLTPGQTIRFLDAIEERIQDGAGSPALSGILARAGVKHVVVRRDLDLFATESPSPSRVDQALLRSPGLSKVASFGTTPLATGLIDIYAVQGPVPLVAAVQEQDVKTVAGGPEDILTALETGNLRRLEPTVNSAEPGWASRPDIVADGYRRRERHFGRQVDSVSQVMTEDEPFRSQRSVHDYPGVEGADRVHASYRQLRAVTASSSGGYADVLGPVRPELGPYSAVDGVTQTYWRSASLERPRGQWLEIDLEEPQPLPELTVQAAVDGFAGIPIRRIRVEAEGQSREQVVDPATGRATVQLSGKPVARIRIVVTSTAGEPETGVVAIREVDIPGVTTSRSLVVPDVQAGPGTTFIFRARPHRRACVDVGNGPECDPDTARPSEEENELTRRFSIDSPGQFTISGRVVARATSETAGLLEPLSGMASVRSSSVLSGDPSVSAQFAFDGDDGTGWLANRGERRPSLTLSFPGERTLTRIEVVASHLPSTVPVRAVLRAGDDLRAVHLGPESFGVFEPLTTDELTITFEPPRVDLPDVDPRPMGVAEVKLRGAERLTYQPNPESVTGAQCGLGPPLVIDGTAYQTRVVGRLADVTGGSPMDLQVCGEAAVALEAGEHELSVRSTDRFATTVVEMSPDAGVPDNGIVARPTAIESWGPSHRIVRVGPGGDAVLRVAENVNDGWEATLDGEPLRRIRVDGWQQGYRLPSGAGGLLELRFTPDAPYRGALLAGLAAAVVLVAASGGAVLRERRQRSMREVLGFPTAFERRWDVPAWVGAILAASVFLLAGAASLVGFVGGLALYRRPPRGLSVTVGVLLLSVLGGVLWALWDQDTPLLAADAAAAGGVGLLMASLLELRRTRGDHRG